MAVVVSLRRLAGARSPILSAPLLAASGVAAAFVLLITCGQRGRTPLLVARAGRPPRERMPIRLGPGGPAAAAAPRSLITEALIRRPRRPGGASGPLCRRPSPTDRICCGSASNLPRCRTRSPLTARPRHGLCPGPASNRPPGLRFGLAPALQASRPRREPHGVSPHQRLRRRAGGRSRVGPFSVTLARRRRASRRDVSSSRGWANGDARLRRPLRSCVSVARTETPPPVLAATKPRTSNPRRTWADNHRFLPSRALTRPCAAASAWTAAVITSQGT
jgi:hypothetical protein